MFMRLWRSLLWRAVGLLSCHFQNRLAVLNRSLIQSNVNQARMRSDRARCRKREGECQCGLDSWQTGGDVDVFIGLSTEPTEPLQGANCFHSGFNGWKGGGQQRPYLSPAYSTMLTYGNNYRGHNLYTVFLRTANITVYRVWKNQQPKTNTSLRSTRERLNELTILIVHICKIGQN